MWPHTRWPGLQWTFAQVWDMWDVVMGGWVEWVGFTRAVGAGRHAGQDR